jgi:hypothetical protein
MAGPAEPLHRAGFRLLWLGSVSANTGTWMQNVGAAWLMTELTRLPLLVALVQSATTLPTLCDRPRRDPTAEHLALALAQGSRSATGAR